MTTDTFKTKHGPFIVNGTMKEGVGEVIQFGNSSIIVIAENTKLLMEFHEGFFTPITGQKMNASKSLKLGVAPACEFQKMSKG